MADYIISIMPDGASKKTYKDGIEIKENVELEQLYQVPALYFEIAKENLDILNLSTEKKLCEIYGTQSFIFSILASEAFVNTFYALRARELKSIELQTFIDKRSGRFVDRLKKCIEISGDGDLNSQSDLLESFSNFIETRHKVVHPRWDPSSLTIVNESFASTRVEGLWINERAPLRSYTFCAKVFWNCALLPARVSETLGHHGDDLRGFIFHWTGLYDVGIEEILSNLSRLNGPTGD